MIRCYVNFDIIRRIMEKHFDLSVVQVMNITDIDDKIIAKAQKCNSSAREVAQQFELDFLSDMSQLGVQPPTLITRVTDYMPQIICFIEKILQQGLAYSVSDGSVYFDLNSYMKKYTYGKLRPNLSSSDLKSDDVNKLKRSPNDFALWKGQKTEWEPSWETPWGSKGRPGWHIECSAMASSIFGSWLDVHSGGIDLTYPHHENEEAQCCAYHDVDQWVGHWIHTNHLHLNDNVKMSKSLGNTISIKDFLKSNSPEHFRMMCLLSNYRSGLEFSDSSLIMSKEVYNSLCHFVSDCQAFFRNCTANVDVPRLLQALHDTKIQIRRYLSDDFNTAQATNAVRQLMSLTNQEMKKTNTSGSGSGAEAVAAVSNFVVDYFDSMGFDLMGRSKSNSDVELNAVIEDLVRFRIQVRRYALGMDEQLTKEEKRQLVKQRRILFEACDSLRDQLKIKGIHLKDQPTGTTWTLNRSF